MVHFKNEEDKINLNMMNAEIKIIDFGLSKILLLLEHHYMKIQKFWK